MANVSLMVHKELALIKRLVFVIENTQAIFLWYHLYYLIPNMFECTGES